VSSRQFADGGEFIRWNEEMSRKYDSESYHLRSNFLIRWIERRRLRAILDFLQAGPADLVVEVGCGAGVVLEQIPAGRVWGMDLSGYILQKTRRRLAHRPAQLLQGNAEKLPFAGDSLHKVVCTEVIEHVLEPARVAQEMARVATADGCIIITIPNEALIDGAKGVIRRLGLARWLLAGNAGEGEAYDSPDEANEWHLHSFNLALLRKVTADWLTIRQVRAIPFAFLPLRYVVLCQKKATTS
jgi:SAM-dependent methyltransferase